MKVLDFSPWQSLESALPISSSSSSDSDLPVMIQRLIAPPRSQKKTQHTHQRRVEGNHILKPGRIDLIPAMILTTRFHLSILGRKSNSGDDSPLVETPEWIYSTKPTPTYAFISPVKEKSTQEFSVPYVAPVVDATRRVVYALQASNHTLVAWHLDRDYGGLDADDERVPKYKFHSPIVSLELLPDPRRLRIRTDNNTNTWVDVIGGISGLCADGGMFLAFHTSSSSEDSFGIPKMLIGTFHESNVDKSPKPNKTGNKTLLLSVIGYTTSSDNETAAVTGRDKGRKRKSSDAEEDQPFELGDIVFTTLSVDRSTDALVLSRCNLEMSSLVWSQNKNSIEPSSHDSKNDLKFNGIYSVRSNLLYLQQQSIQHIFVTQLDATHVSLVYNTSTSSPGQEEWLCSLLDIRRESLFPHPFALSRRWKDSGRVLKVTGISSALIAVLSDDDMIQICDVRRAVIVNIINMQSLPGFLRSMEVKKSDLISDWHSGSLYVIMHPQKGEPNQAQSIVCSAKIRLHDGDWTSSDGTNRALRGSYNLASILASTLMSSKKMHISGIIQPCVMRDIKSVHPNLYSSDNKNGYSTRSLDFNQYIRRLESFRPGKIKSESKAETFASVYYQIIHSTPGINGSSSKDQKLTKPHKNGLNGIHDINDKDSSKKETPDGYIMADVNNTAASVAVDIILSTTPDQLGFIKTLVTLLEIIETGQVSARIAFASNKASNRFFDLLMKLNRAEQSRKYVVKLICCIIHGCSDSLPESMLVILVDCVLCHLSESQIVESFDDMKTIDHDPKVHRLIKSLKLANGTFPESNGSSQPRQSLSLRNRLALNLKISLIGSIISYSHCNATLLRAALRRELRNADNGEIAVLFQILTILLRQENRGGIGSKSRTWSAIYWLAALIDSHMGSFTAVTPTGIALRSSIDAVRKVISLMVVQGETMATLNDLLDQFVAAGTRNRTKTKSTSILTLSNDSNISTPDYCIEPLIF